MRAIPKKLRDLLERMPRMKRCELISGKYGACGSNAIQWHHVWIYAGRQINEHWAILAACERHHSAVKHNRSVREAFERHSLEIATDEELGKYPNKDWLRLKKYLKVIPFTSSGDVL